MLRGVFHFHSRYSFDSLSTIPAIANSLEQLRLDFAILTDHDDIQGSQALQRELKKRKLQIYVPTAAEYSTELGDIIIVGLYIKFFIFNWHTCYNINFFMSNKKSMRQLFRV